MSYFVINNAFFPKKLHTSLVFMLLLPTLPVMAQTIDKAPSDNPSVKQPVTIEPPPPMELPEQLPSEQEKGQVAPQMTLEESKIYLSKHPEELEAILTNFLRTGNVAGLKAYLPIYAVYPQRDESVIDWGNAIIAMKEGRFNDAIRLYRKINAALPEVKLVRFQLANALLVNKQYAAAKSEFIKLRSEMTDPKDIELVDSYLAVINRQNRWNISGNLGYLNDKNINNAPSQGTSIEVGDTKLTYLTPNESGKGLSYSIGADKKWSLGDNLFTAVHLNGYGKYYTDNKKYNEANAGIGAGIGYQNAQTEVELYPMITRGWYGGGGKFEDEKLGHYSDTKSLNLTVGHWITPNWQYQNFTQYSEVEYQDKWKVNNGKHVLNSHTLMYMPRPTQYFYGRMDYIDFDNTAGYYNEGYERLGQRLGWGQVWGKGISTTAEIGYAKKDFKSANYFGIEQKDKEYTADVSIWKRDLSLLGLTPRLGYSYKKVESNNPFAEYDKNNVNFSLTKTF